MYMSDETKITLKMGIIASAVSSFLIFVLSVLWIHQTDITLLKTNQVSVLKMMEKMSTMPEEIAKLNVRVEFLIDNQQVHKDISARNYSILKDKK